MLLLCQCLNDVCGAVLCSQLTEQPRKECLSLSLGTFPDWRAVSPRMAVHVTA